MSGGECERDEVGERDRTQGDDSVVVSEGEKESDAVFVRENSAEKEHLTSVSETDGDCVVVTLRKCV